MRRIFIYFLNVISVTPIQDILCCFYIYVHVRFGIVYFYYNVDDDKFISHIKNSVQ